MTHYCICDEDTDPWCPEHGDEVDDLLEEFGYVRLADGTLQAPWE